MKSGLKSRGFTIVEVLIFLAVSSALMVSAFALISGSQNKASFTQSINDVQQQIDSVINNVANGYYSAGETQNKCTLDGNGKPKFDPDVEVNRGSSALCIFLGRFIAFEDGSDKYTVYNVAGRRQIAGNDVKRMLEAKPTVIVGTEQEYTLKNGLTFKSNNGINAFGFFNGLGASSGVSDQLNSGYQQASFFGFKSSAIEPLPGYFELLFDQLKNPTDGYALCFNSGTTNQSGVITIGGSDRAATSSLEIKGGSCP